MQNGRDFYQGMMANASGVQSAEYRIHKPVLVGEVIEALNCQSGRVYVDCTLGMGGHADKILQASSPDGRLLGLDRDQEAIGFARERLRSYGLRVDFVREDYRKLQAVLKEMRLHSVAGILADLGPSLLQFSSADRGFSFLMDGPLDMRMDTRQALTATDIVNTYSAPELRTILRQYAEEPKANAIANRIVEERKKGPIQTTGRLREIVESVRKRKPQDKIHPATLTFQALRIAVNRELEDLDAFVFDAFDALDNGGRLAIIAFHSLEDRVVKQSFQFLTAACRCPKRFQMCQCGGEPYARALWRKPVRPSEQEIKTNPASRSAKLRAIEKLKGPAPRELWEEWRKAR